MTLILVETALMVMVENRVTLILMETALVVIVENQVVEMTAMNQVMKNLLQVIQDNWSIQQTRAL